MKKILLLFGLVLIQASAYAGNTIFGRIIDDANGSPLIGASAAIVDGNGNIVTGSDCRACRCSAPNPSYA